MGEGKKITQNIAWLMFDSFFILFLQFVVGVKVANYYGAELYGKYSYAVSLIAFAAIFFELINGRVIKKFYDGDNFDKIVHNVNVFRNSIAIFLFVSIFIFRIFVKMDNLLFYMLVFMCLDNILVTSTSGIENFFEFKLESKRIVISNNIVKLISYVLQYIGMLLGMGIVFLPIIRCIGNFIRMLILKYQYRKEYLKNIERKKDRFDRRLIYRMVYDSRFLWIGFISFLVYSQIDRIMIKHYMGEADVGIYTIGFQLAGILAILIGPVQNSLFPKMLELYRKDYKGYYNFYLFANSCMTQLYLVLTLISIVVVKLLFGYVYSAQYLGAIDVYIILAFSILVKANGSLQTGHMTLKDITKKSAYKTFISLVINVVLNVILIKKYGVNGAAIATLITQIISLIIMDFFIPEYREHAWIQLKSFNTFVFVKKGYNLIKRGGRDV